MFTAAFLFERDTRRKSGGYSFDLHGRWKTAVSMEAE